MGLGGGGSDFKVSVRVQHLVSNQLPWDPLQFGAGVGVRESKSHLEIQAEKQ